MKFHVNPETGNVGKCSARKQCPFGDLQKDHYATESEARRAYEAVNKAFEKSLENLIPVSPYTVDEVFALITSDNNGEEKLAFIKDPATIFHHSSALMTLAQDKDGRVREAVRQLYRKLEEDTPDLAY